MKSHSERNCRNTECRCQLLLSGLQVVFLVEDLELSIHICKMGAIGPPIGPCIEDCVKGLLRDFGEPR